jgi:hypothetical protein
LSLFLYLIMNEIVFLVEEAVEGGYNARAIGESIYTQGNTFGELKFNIADAIACHFDNAILPEFALKFVANIK